MREIKFRAWLGDIPKLFNLEDIATWGPSWEGPGFAEYNNWEQYTGLKDKNGREIYEGDWVQIIDHPENITTRADVVVFENGMFGTASETAVPLCDYGMVWVEVIGNIHENPELWGET